MDSLALSLCGLAAPGVWLFLLLRYPLITLTATVVLLLGVIVFTESRRARLSLQATDSAASRRSRRRTYVIASVIASLLLAGIMGACLERAPHSRFSAREGIAR